MHAFKGERAFFNYFRFLFGAVAFKSCEIIFLCVLSQKVICQWNGTYLLRHLTKGGVVMT